MLCIYIKSLVDLSAKRIHEPNSTPVTMTMTKFAATGLPAMLADMSLHLPPMLYGATMFSLKEKDATCDSLVSRYGFEDSVKDSICDSALLNFSTAHSYMTYAKVFMNEDAEEA